MYNPYQAQAIGEQSIYGDQTGKTSQSAYSNEHVNANSYINNYQTSQQYNGNMNHVNNNNNNSNMNFNSNSNGNGNGIPLNTFFTDPATQMGLQFSQSAFNASQQYMQHNLQQFVSNEDIKYYFKVSNLYVMKKLMLILFPYKNKTWIRQLKGNNESNNGISNTGDVYATPIEDVNAPDLYIPTMAFLSYILVWALGEGVKGDFHPEMLGYATTRTLAFYIMDFILLRISFYVLGISSKNSKMWDLVSYTGYKFVPILVLLIFDTLFGSSAIIKYTALIVLTFSLGFFMMRSLRYVVLPGGGFDGGSRIRMQYLFAYCFIIQGLFIWLMA